jgi:phosphotriesterase-related protein
VHAKLIRAAARVHLTSGLPIAIHTGDGTAALAEARILREEGVAPAALIWVHAQNGSSATQVEMAKLGAWVSLDGFNALQRDRYTKYLTDLKREKLLGRVLLSHDHFWSVENGGMLKRHSGAAETAYESIFVDLLPHLRTNGFSEDEIRQLTVQNPGEAFVIRVRRL